MSQEELTNKTIRRIYNRGKEKATFLLNIQKKQLKTKIYLEKSRRNIEVFKREQIKVIDEAQVCFDASY